MTIGEKLKKSRNDKGMSLRELATKVELSASFLSQIEQGKASPSIENLKKIAHTLDVRVAYLLEDEDDDIRNIEYIIGSIFFSLLFESKIPILILESKLSIYLIFSFLICSIFLISSSSSSIR